MSDNSFDQALALVGQEAFETLAMMLPATGEDTLPLPPPAQYCARAGVNFEGHFRGRLELCVSPEMLPELGANVLGMDDPRECSIDHRLDALKELLNAMCGNLLPLISDGRSNVSVHAPEIIDQLNASCTGLFQAGQASLWLDAGWAELTLYLPAQAAGRRVALQAARARA